MLIYIVALVIYLLSLLAGMVCLFFKKSRAVAKYLLSGLGVITLVVLIWLFIYQQPITFERNYLQSQVKVTELKVKQQSEQAQVYIGAAPSNLAQMLTPAFKQTFTSVTPENALKLGDLFNIETLAYDFSAADAIVDEALNNNLRVRGHALIFGKLSDVYKKPDLTLWLSQFPAADRKAQLQALVDRHFERVLNHYRGKITEWDVINEPLEMFSNGSLEENVFYRHLGAEYIAQAFIKAKTIDASLTLYLNEQFYNYTDQRAEAFYQLVVNLLAQGVPIDGIGLQGHMLFYLASVAETTDYIKRFTALGLKVQLTEFEARLRLFENANDPYQAQGEYYRAMLAACYALDGFDGITFWGVSDDKSWLDEMSWLFPLPNEPYLLDANQAAKPGLILISELLKRM
ncbi:MAG: endo-1,4-beta-xylanase [Thalassotalea sp.]